MVSTQAPETRSLCSTARRCKAIVDSLDVHRRAVKLVHALNFQDLTADSGHLRAHGVEEVTEVLDFGLGRGVDKGALATGQHCGHENVLRPGHRRVVHEYASTSQPVGGGLCNISFAHALHLGTKRLETRKVDIDGALADDIATGGSGRGIAVAGQERAHNLKRRPILGDEFGRGFEGAHI